MISAEGVLWTEKYRPESLDQLALPEDDREFIENALEDGGIPHLLLSGPPGIGKTTLAYILREKLDCTSIVLNASKERGIDVIRNRVSEFARSMLGARWNIVILDEADALTREAQNSLRNLMETFSDKCRFILTANYPQKISEAIRSRCHELRLARLEPRDRFKALVRVLKQEEIDYDPENAGEFAKAYQDLRKMLNAAQRSILTHGELRVSDALLDDIAKDVLKNIHEDNWSSIVEHAKNPDINHTQLLVEMFWIIPEDFSQAAAWRHEIAKAVHESAYTPDDVVHFLGLCANLIKQT